ncbi:MAG TPA: alpha/beta fold hydrolase [Thermoanaerobaculia bacterium]|nr:alpha/beta fold hydrolase [Thermoanaerobaculia bacterium]
MVLIRTLPGFLGLQSDWDFLPWPTSPLAPHPRGVVQGEGQILLGYSMGGRLALQLLESQRFSKAVIISAGLNSPDPARVQRDEEWARRFESDDWPALMRDWNAQPVFGGHVLDRREEDYSRSELARQLREYSPAVLPPPRLESIETPLLWIAGERDAKYVEIAHRAVARLPHAELWVCPDAGHRVPWEQPLAFIDRLRRFLELQ